MYEALHHRHLSVNVHVQVIQIHMPEERMQEIEKKETKVGERLEGT